MSTTLAPPTDRFAISVTQTARGVWQCTSPQYPGVVGKGRTDEEAEIDFMRQQKESIHISAR